MRKFINNILFSISKRLNWYHSMKTWSKYGDETRYHFNNPNIEIGDFTYGIPDVTIYDIGVTLKIGRYCSIAKDVRILLGGEHPVDHVSTFPFHKLKKYFPNAVSEFDPRKYDVSIGNDVWLGRGVTVLSGVTIGNGAVIGAGAVVSKNIPPYCIAVGNPIKILRKRFDEEKIRFLEENQWWNYTPKKINKILPIMQNINDYESRINGGVKLSIIIVSYNTRDVTRECLKSIQTAEWRDTYEIIVVDNNSSDGSVNMIRSEFPDVIVIANSDNRFFAIANNQGASIAKGEYLLLLNSDTLVYGDNIQKMIDFFDSLPEDVICIGPKLLNRDKTLQACGFPLAFNPIKHTATLFGLDKIFPLYRLDSSFYRKPDRTHQTGWVTGACMMIPADKYAQVGGLNENLVFYGEEPEFGYRTSKCGYKTMYYADAEIIHLGGGSTKADKESRYSFEKDIKSYDSLISETVGAKRAITITRCTRFSLIIKWLFYKDKKYIASRINHEGRVIDYFKQKVKLSNDN